MRKLAWFAVFFAAAALFSLTLQTEARGFLWIPAAAVFALSWFKRLKHESVLRFARVAALGFALGCLYVLLWQGLTARELAPLLEREQAVEATVLEDSRDSSFGKRTDIRVGRVRCCLFTDGAENLEAGEKIRVKARFAGTLEKTDSDYYLTLGVPLFAYAREKPERLGMAEAGWRFLPARLGRYLRERIRELYDRESAAFLLAVLTGDREALRQDTHFYAMLRVTGLSHCVAVSGMHLSFLLMFLYVLLGRNRLSLLVSIPLTLLFMAMTGFTASVVRAGVMQLCVCCARWFRREYDSLSALHLALLLLLLLNPYSVRSTGLLLSYFSTLGILLFYQSICGAMPGPPKSWGKHGVCARLWRGARSTLAVSLSSGIATVPLNALFFRQISLLAPITNLLVLWAVSLCFVLGLTGVLLSLVSITAGSLFRLPLGLLVGYIRLAVTGIGRFPLAALYIRSPYLPVWLCLTWLSLALCRYLPKLRHRAGSFAVIAAGSLAVFLALSYWEPALDTFRFCVLDVGQGQCLVMNGADGVILVDCGGSLSANAGDLAAEYLLSMGKYRADALVLTHFHQDHVNGVEELLRRIPVGAIYCPRPEAEDGDARSLLEFAKERGTAAVFVERDVLWLNRGSTELALIPPLNRDKENESGLCIAVQNGAFSALCTGDAGSGTEQRLLERMRLEGLTLLVAGHHGSAGSVSERLLEAVRPKAVAISVGRNTYGLPSEKTLRRIRGSGAAIYRTDEQGSVILRYGRILYG